MYFIRRFLECDFFDVFNEDRTRVTTARGECAAEIVLLDFIWNIIISDNFGRAGFLDGPPRRCCDSDVSIKVCPRLNKLKTRRAPLSHLRWTLSKDEVPVELQQQGVTPQDWSETWSAMNQLFEKACEEAQSQRLAIDRTSTILAKVLLKQKTTWEDLVKAQSEKYYRSKISVLVLVGYQTLIEIPKDTSKCRALCRRCFGGPVKDRAVSVPCGLEFRPVKWKEYIAKCFGDPAATE